MAKIHIFLYLWNFFNSRHDDAGDSRIGMGPREKHTCRGNSDFESGSFDCQSVLCLDFKANSDFWEILFVE